MGQLFIYGGNDLTEDLEKIINEAFNDKQNISEASDSWEKTGWVREALEKVSA